MVIATVSIRISLQWASADNIQYFMFVSVDYISAPFKMNKIEMFEGYDNPTHFFRPSLRSLLVRNIQFYPLYILYLFILMYASGALQFIAA